jgi:hypothetical protein
VRDSKNVGHMLAALVKHLVYVKKSIAEWNKLTGKTFNLGTVHVPEELKSSLAYLQHHAMKHTTHASGVVDERLVKYVSRKAGVTIKITKCTKDVGSATIEFGLGILNVSWFNNGVSDE